MAKTPKPPECSYDDMGKTVNVKSENQLGGITAGEINTTGDIKVDNRVEQKPDDLPKSAKLIGWAVGFVAAAIAIYTFISSYI